MKRIRKGIRLRGEVGSQISFVEVSVIARQIANTIIDVAQKCQKSRRKREKRITKKKKQDARNKT